MTFISVNLALMLRSQTVSSISRTHEEEEEGGGGCIQTTKNARKSGQKRWNCLKYKVPSAEGLDIDTFLPDRSRHTNFRLAPHPRLYVVLVHNIE